MTEYNFNMPGFTEKTVYGRPVNPFYTTYDNGNVEISSTPCTSLNAFGTIIMICLIICCITVILRTYQSGSSFLTSFATGTGGSICGSCLCLIFSIILSFLCLTTVGPVLIWILVFCAICSLLSNLSILFYTIGNSKNNCKLDKVANKKQNKKKKNKNKNNKKTKKNTRTLTQDNSNSDVIDFISENDLMAD